jgi:hypothetical protein
MPYTDKVDDYTKRAILRGNYLSYTKQLTITLDELKRRVESGEELEFLNSSFSDPGADWTAMLCGGKEVTPRIPGY